jgi:hypothetical protein
MAYQKDREEKPYLFFKLILCSDYLDFFLNPSFLIQNQIAAGNYIL